MSAQSSVITSYSIHYTKLYDAKNFADLIEYFLENVENAYELYFDDRIQTDVSKMKWLCFSDCMNNGGTSSLYIDFTPSEKGTKGQIIRVITSYSIHYTKLYDVLSNKR